MTSDESTGQEKKSKPAGKPDAEILWAASFLTISMAMIIWPDALSAPGPCDPDEVMGCFISNSWGTPAGIAISSLIGLLSGILALRKRWKRGNG